MTRLALLTIVALLGQTGTPAPAVDPKLIRIYVHTGEVGGETTLSARRESVRDLVAALGSKKKDLLIVAHEDQADVVVEVTERLLTTPRVVFGLGARPGQPPGGNAPARAVRLVVTIAQARGSDPDEIANRNAPLEANRGWRSAADDVAKQVEKWVADRRAAILAARERWPSPTNPPWST